MIISPDILPDWSSKDAELLEDVLRTAMGQKLLAILAFQAPELLDGTDNGKTLVASGVAKGYSRAVETIVSLTKTPPIPAPVAPPAYPPLDDEKFWTDPT